MVLVWIIGIIVVVILLAFIYYFNRFVALGNRVDNSLSQIDVQLRKRADLVPNLVKTVKGYAKHEKGIMKDVTDARKHFMGAKDMKGKIEAGNEMQKALKSILAIAENYPQLRASENFLHLQQELAAIEDKVAYARQYYNDSILSYNDLCKAFPGVFFAGIYGKKAREYLKIPVESRAVPKIDF